MPQISKQPAFELGQIVATPGALAALRKAGQQPTAFGKQTGAKARFRKGP